MSKSFVETYFPGDKPVKVTREGSNSRTEYDVTLASGFSVEFDAVGEWTDVDGPMNVAITNDGFIPQPIRDYVAANYTDAGINEISRDSRGYEVELTNQIELQFDQNGNFVRVDN